MSAFTVYVSQRKRIPKIVPNHYSTMQLVSQRLQTGKCQYSYLEGDTMINTPPSAPAIPADTGWRRAPTWTSRQVNWQGWVGEFPLGVFPVPRGAAALTETPLGQTTDKPDFHILNRWQFYFFWVKWCMFWCICNLFALLRRQSWQWLHVDL